MGLIKVGEKYVNSDFIEYVNVGSYAVGARVQVVLTSGRVVGEIIPDGVDPEDHLRAVVNRINTNT